MIGSVTGGTSFGGLVRYLTRDGQEREIELPGGFDKLADYLTGDERAEIGTPGQSRAAWTATRNLKAQDPRGIAAEMRATAELSARVQKPVYHLSISAAPGERFDQERWEAIADRVLKDLGLQEHQVMIVAHRDRAHDHIHLVVNRVHPEKHRAWDNGFDYRRIERSLRLIERDLELRRVPGRHYRLPERLPERMPEAATADRAAADEPPAPERIPERREGRTDGERREAERTGRVLPFDLIEGQAKPILREAKSWAELEARLAEKGLRIEAKGQGLVVTDGRREVKASRIARDASRRHLEQRLGMEFSRWRRLRGELVHTARRLDTLQARDLRLSHIETAARQRAGHAGVTFDRVRMARGEQAHTVERLRSLLGHLYGPEPARHAGWRLARAVHRHGWQATIEELRHRPERFGKLRGGPLRVLGLGREAKELRHLAADALGQVGRARLELRHLRPELRHARRVFEPATRRAQRAVLASRRLGDLQPLELRLARLTLRLGIQAASFVLEPSLLKVARLATRVLSLGAELERGSRGR